jgi:pteridine reductase
MQNNDYVNKVALVTGGARRIGEEICRTLHASGMRVVVHFNSSEPDANKLINSLNAIRENSAAKIRADLGDTDSLAPLVKDTCALFGRLDVLINNASRFYATPLATVTPGQWQDMVGTNLKAPLFLAQNAATELARTKGCIINIIDIYAERPLADHPVYCVAKAGLVMLTKALAVDLAPDIRVNAVSPGAILWPENEPDDEQREAVLRRIPSGRSGMPNDIAQAVRFLVQEADYISGQVITVDGGRSVVS